VGGSISLTLDRLSAVARVFTVEPGKAARTPRFRQDGSAVAGVAADRMAAFLDRIAASSGTRAHLATEVEADFPVGAGLASSAAIYCAVSAAALAVCGVRVDRAELSAIARVGSGSAARSVHGGFVEWRRGERADGRDSIATGLLPAAQWPVAMAVAITSTERKSFASRDAM